MASIVTTTGHLLGDMYCKKGTHDGKKKRDSFYQHQEAGKQKKNQMGGSMWGNTSEHSFETESESLSVQNEMSTSREAEVKRVVNTGNWMEKPVWTNVNRVNHANQFVPRSVQLNAGRPKLNTVRPNINTGQYLTRPQKVRSLIRPKMNQVNQRRDFSKLHSSVRRPFAKTTAQMSHSNAVMGSWGSAVKTSNKFNWRAHGHATRINWRILEGIQWGSVYFGKVAKAT
ncbi:hypothetical protein Tco_0241053 [Tanacetum coccineum]